MANGKHRLLVSDVNEDLQQFKEARTTHDQTVEQQLAGLEQKLATRDGDFKESLRKARLAYEANPKQDRSISRLFVIAHAHEQIAREHEAKMREVQTEITRIHTLLESGGSVNERRAETRVTGLGPDIDKAFEASDKLLDDFRTEVNDHFTKVEERIDRRKAEIKEVRDDLALSKVDLTEQKVEITRHTRIFDGFPKKSAIISLVLAAVVGFVAFLIRFAAGSGFETKVLLNGANYTVHIEEPLVNRFWVAVIIGLAFFALTAFVLLGIVLARFINTWKNETKTETVVTKSTSKSSTTDDDDTDDKDDDDDDDHPILKALKSKMSRKDNDTKPVKTVTKERETVKA